MARSDEESKIVPGAILLDRYRAIRIVGAGGMGVVAHAAHLADGYEVAIKFLLPQFVTSREAATRFVREARAASKIPSEHVTRVLDTGTSDDWGPYIVMEFLRGADLSRHVRKGFRAPIELGVDYVVQAAHALAHAHAVGVIHRDVKPANLFLVEQAETVGVVKVLDFGISKLVDEAPLEVTKTTTVLGSGLYMSPEQMRSAKSVDHRTDIYGLGVSMYELFTGTQPFTAETYPDLCIKVAMDAPDPIRRHRPDIPEELASVIARAYARSLKDRYDSIASFCVALRPWASQKTSDLITAIERLGRARIALASEPSIPPPVFNTPNLGSIPPMPLSASATMAEAALADTESPNAKPAFGGTAPPGGGLAPASAATGSMTPPPLIETSTKNFARTSGEDSGARTMLLAAFGTFLALTGAVLVYFFVLRPKPVDAPAAAAPTTVVAVATSAPIARDSSDSATVDSATGPMPPTVSADPTAPPSASEAMVAASGSANGANSANPRGWKPPTTPSAKPVASTAPSVAPTPSVAPPPSDPFGCFENGLRVACPPKK